MNPDDYLASVLQSQKLGDDSSEMKELRSRRDEVEDLLRGEFNSPSPIIRYGGSMAKNTLIRESYDLDIVCYFANDDGSAGGTIEDIYNNVHVALKKKYGVRKKTSAIRLLGEGDVDFYVDVVPGRFTDDSRTDAFLHRELGSKKHLKTNLDDHISHVKESGVTAEICLMKLWKERNAITVRTFPLELLTIKLLDGNKSGGISNRLAVAWTEIRDNIESVAIEDPANPAGNDLSEIFTADARKELGAMAKTTLETIGRSGWEKVFGPVDRIDEAEKGEAIRRAAASVKTPTRPWCA